MDAFYALAEPRRRKIMELLAANGILTATQICRKFDVSAQAISQHLKVLLNAKLVNVEKHSQKRMYSINQESLIEMENWIEVTTMQWNNRLDKLDKLLANTDKRIKK